MLQHGFGMGLIPKAAGLAPSAGQASPADGGALYEAQGFGRLKPLFFSVIQCFEQAKGKCLAISLHRLFAA